MDRSGQSVPAQRRYLDVAQSILASINVGEYVAGQRLPGDRDLASARGVSRQTAREALLVLELIGSVVIRHGDGVYVSVGSASIVDQANAILYTEPRNLIESRCLFEPITARLAAQRITDVQVEVLGAIVDESEQLTDDPRQFKRFMSLGLEFHAVLAKSCGNDLMGEMVGQLVNVEQHPLWVLVNEQALRTKTARLGQMAEHRAILLAVESRDPEKAEAEMRDHLVELQGYIFSAQ